MILHIRLHQNLPMFPARAKNVIYLHMAGAPSQLELFDYKPELMKLMDNYVRQVWLKENVLHLFAAFQKCWVRRQSLRSMEKAAHG